MWSLLANLLGGTFKDWVTHKSEIEKQQTAARIENTKSHLSGYSDEILLLVWSYPIIGSFIPSQQLIVEQGFKHLDLLPEWYAPAYIAISFSVFGVNKLFKLKK